LKTLEKLQSPSYVRHCPVLIHANRACCFVIHVGCHKGEDITPANYLRDVVSLDQTVLDCSRHLNCNI
jgi:hypothetical protein